MPLNYVVRWHALYNERTADRGKRAGAHTRRTASTPHSLDSSTRFLDSFFDVPPDSAGPAETAMVRRSPAARPPRETLSTMYGRIWQFLHGYGV